MCLQSVQIIIAFYTTSILMALSGGGRGVRRDFPQKNGEKILSPPLFPPKQQQQQQNLSDTKKIGNFTV